jgi:hypothetical protein
VGHQRALKTMRRCLGSLARVLCTAWAVGAALLEGREPEPRPSGS